MKIINTEYSIARSNALGLEPRGRRFKSCYSDKKMVLGAAGSGRLPVTQYKQVGSNPIETANVRVRKAQKVLSSNW